MHGSATDTILKITDVTKSFGQVAALKGMRLEVRRGRVHTLLGENGAGKSTLMKILAGVHTATSGEITLDGQAYRPASPQDAASLGLAIVFQELSLCNNLTVAENILATREPRRFGFINDKALVAQARRIVADLGLPIDVTEKVGNLSIAQRQLVEIAKGLSHDAEVVILDEPTSSLSDSEAEILFAIMRLSDDITVIRDGEYVSTHAREEVTIEALIALMVGRRMDEIYPPAVHAVARDKAPVLSVERLTREGEFQDVSFEVRAGEILGFFGLVGSGRSEVMNAIFGMKNASGAVRLNGEVVRFRSPDEAIARRVGFVTENRKEEGLVLGHSVEWNISMAALGDFTGGFGFIRNGAERAAASAQVGNLSIKTNSLDTPSGALSGGNQQKIVIAKWLLTRPRVLILDEPTRGVDVGAKFEIYKIIRQLAAEGTAILLISSDLPEVLGMSDRVVVMHEGAPGATLEGPDLTPETIMAHATGFQS